MVWRFFRKLWVVGFEERIWKSFLRIHFSLGKPGYYMMIRELGLWSWVGWGGGPVLVEEHGIFVW